MIVHRHVFINKDNIFIHTVYDVYMYKRSSTCNDFFFFTNILKTKLRGSYMIIKNVYRKKLFKMLVFTIYLKIIKIDKEVSFLDNYHNI